MKNLSIDEYKFSKISKKLQSELISNHSLDIKLSEIQEILARSLGFRNLNQLQKSLGNESMNNESYTVNPDTFKGMTMQEISHAIYWRPSHINR